MQRWKQTCKALVMVLTLGLLWPHMVLAQHASPNYRVDESSFGSGGVVDAESDNYGGRGSLGDLAAGNTASDNFQAYAGFTTADEEYLEFITTGGVKDLGELTTTSTGTGTAAFSVRSYLSSGYVVTVHGPPPTNYSGPRALFALPAPAISTQGVEQFGINLRNNDVPDVGADPVDFPDNTYSYGEIATDYGTVDEFKYVDGDIIALSNESSGRTDFTVSMIANVTGSTPGGAYETSLKLVATPTF